jgi:hypothetical protein
MGKHTAVVGCWDDPLGRSITLFQHRLDHIEGDHGDMEDRVHLIRAAIERPVTIRHDAVRPDRESFYAHAAEFGSDMYVKASVAFEAPDLYGIIAGTVITAFPTPRLKRGQQPLWP